MAAWQLVGQSTARKRGLNSPEPHDRSKVIRTKLSSNNTNSYSALSCDDENDKIEADPTAESVKVPKPPAIIVERVANVQAMHDDICSVINAKDYYYKSMSNGEMRIMTLSTDAYRKLTHHFDKTNISYHSYQLKQERAYRVFIKNIHFSTKIDDIKNDLIQHGHQPRNIINLKSKIDKQPLSIFVVDLEPDPNNKSIYDIKYLVNAVIKVEPPKRSADLVQCHRCQQFGHTKSMVLQIIH